MHIVKILISVLLSFFFGFVVFILSLLCTINLPLWINGPPEHPAMPVGEVIISFLIAVVSGIILLLVLLKKYARIWAKQ